jgi:hypothetical protein
MTIKASCNVWAGDARSRMFLLELLRLSKGSYTLLTDRERGGGRRKNAECFISIQQKETGWSSRFSNWLQAGRPSSSISSPDRGRILSSPCRTERLWGSPSLLYSGERQKYIYICNRPWRPAGLWDVEASHVSQSVVEVEVTLRLTVSQSVSMSWHRVPLWDLRPDIISCWMLLSEICGLVSGGRPLWRENGSAICGVINQWSESFRIRNHTLLSHLRLTQPGGPGSRIYIPQEQGGPVIPPGTVLPLRHLLRLASYDLQGYGGGILTLPVYIFFRNRMV